MIELAEARQIANAEYHQGDIDILGRFAGTADLVLLIGGLFLYVAAGVACAFAPTFDWVIAARFVWRLGAPALAARPVLEA